MQKQDDKPLMKNPKPQRTAPVWKGPEVDGITFSLLSRFLTCRERFRILVVEGLKPADHFESRMEFGNMWHVCEETFAKLPGEGPSGWEEPLKLYAANLCKKYRGDQQQIDHWYSICKALFPLYVNHWAKHPDVQNRTPLLQEQPFDVPYKLPSGRTVRLRGKWDSVDLIGKPMKIRHAMHSGGQGIWIQENKTKSSIDGQKLARQLTFDLQTMIYVVALELEQKGEERFDAREQLKTYPILGVRYNVIRRSAHKSVDSMLKKLEDDREAGRIGEWFGRWKVEVSQYAVEKFRRQCLDPILEQLCKWYELIKRGSDPFANFLDHFRFPYGIYNPLTEGGNSDLDPYLESRSEVGLQRVDNLFPELS
jgi:hypothetical protein